MDREIAVVLIDPRLRSRKAQAALLEGSPGFVLLAACTAAHAAPACGEPDVVLVRCAPPAISDVETLRLLRGRFPAASLLVVASALDLDHATACLAAGGGGYLVGEVTPVSLLAAIVELCDGGAPLAPEVARHLVRLVRRGPRPVFQAGGLSQRQAETLKLFAEGHSYRSAAGFLGVSVDTVRFHVRSVYAKLDVHSKSEAVGKALREGLLR